MASKSQKVVSFDLRKGLSAEELDRELLAAARLVEDSAREVALCLAELEQCEGYLELGFPTLESFAEEQLGLDPATVRERLAMGRALLDAGQ